MHHRFSLTVPSLCLLGLAACASSGSREDAPIQVDAMITWIERVHVEAERSRQEVADSFERLNALAAGRFDKDPAAVLYARFVQAIDSAEQQAKRFREVVGPMLETAQPVFVQWQKDVKTIANESLRARGELRFQVAKQRYDAIKSVAVPAQDKFDVYVKDLRDHAAFLAHDLNAAALDDIQEEVKRVAGNARELDRQMETCQAAARTYVESSSLPAAPAR